MLRSLALSQVTRHSLCLVTHSTMSQAEKVPQYSTGGDLIQSLHREEPIAVPSQVWFGVCSDDHVLRCLGGVAS